MATNPFDGTKIYTCAGEFKLSKTHNQPTKAPHTWEITFDFTVAKEPPNFVQVKCKE